MFSEKYIKLNIKYKACSISPSRGVLLHVENWVRLCNALIGPKIRLHYPARQTLLNPSNKATIVPKSVDSNAKPKDC
jgi:hypothetical protein